MTSNQDFTRRICQRFRWDFVGWSDPIRPGIGFIDLGCSLQKMSLLGQRFELFYNIEKNKFHSERINTHLSQLLSILNRIKQISITIEISVSNGNVKQKLFCIAYMGKVYIYGLFSSRKYTKNNFFFNLDNKK